MPEPPRNTSAFKTGASAAIQSAVEPSGADRRGALKHYPLTSSRSMRLQVVDASGGPLEVYHGMASSFDAFDSNAIGSNYGKAGETVYVAFSPEQIKSAIGNRGTFNGSDPNILRSTRSVRSASAGFSLPEETTAQQALPCGIY